MLYANALKLCRSFHHLLISIAHGSALFNTCDPHKLSAPQVIAVAVRAYLTLLSFLLMIEARAFKERLTYSISTRKSISQLSKAHLI